MEYRLFRLVIDASEALFHVAEQEITEQNVNPAGLVLHVHERNKTKDCLLVCEIA